MTNLDILKLQKDLDTLLKAHGIEPDQAGVLASSFARLVKNRKTFLADVGALADKHVQRDPHPVQ